MADIVEIIRIISGSVFALFLPGFAWSFVFFEKDEIDWIIYEPQFMADSVASMLTGADCS